MAHRHDALDDVVNLGEFEELCLAAIVHLGDGAYGMTVHEQIEGWVPRRFVSLGAVYTTVDRLEAKGLVESEYRDATEERGRRKKRCLNVTATGLRALRGSLERLNFLRPIATGLGVLP